MDDIRRLDLKNGLLEAERRFSQERDLWLTDHQPFRFLKHPVVSGIMAVEAFLEAARLFNPHLIAVGLRQVRFLDLLESQPA